MRNNHTDNPFSVLNLSAVHSRETGSATPPVAPFGIFVWITTSNMRAYVRFFLPTFVYAAALIAASSTTASAQTFRSDAPSEANLTSFGGAVAINGDQIFVGEARNNVKPGTVHVFAKQGSEWTVVEELEAEDGEVNDRFGSAVAADGNTLLVSANGDEGKGIVYVFTKGNDGAWRQTGTLADPEGADGDSFGSTVAIRGNIAAIAAERKNSRAGAVFVSTRNADGSWSPLTMLTGAEISDGDAFGSALSIGEKTIFVGASRYDAGAGAAFVFRQGDNGGWNFEGQLPRGDAGDSGFFGSAIETDGHHVYVGAPRANDGSGLVVTLMMNEGEWQAHESILAPADSEKALFGTAIALSGNTVVVGAPGTNSNLGSVRTYVMDHMAHGWKETGELTFDGLEGRAFYGSRLVANGNMIVVGVPSADHGAGSGAIFVSNGDVWSLDARLEGEITNYGAVLGEQVNCDEGAASDFSCSRVDLVSFLPVGELGGERGVRLNDVWGWTDPVTGHEYALVGRIDGTSFVDITNATNPVFVGNLPRTEGTPASTWRDIKTYKDHAFIVADNAGEHGVQIFDLTKLRDAKNLPVTFAETAHYDGIHSAHNIVINEDTGFAYSVGSSSGGETCGGGLHMINIQDPSNPQFAGCFADPTTGRASTGYSHDAQCITYHGPDTEHDGKEICFGANETALSIADVTDKDNPVSLSVGKYPNVGYAHQGWITEDHRYFLLDDELDELQGNTDGTRTLIWDVTDLDDPKLLKEYISENKSSDHNLYIKGNYAYMSNYQSGLRILDITDIQNPVEFGFFDTVPYGTDTPGFGGSWSNYPFFKSGNVIVTSGYEGLFVVRKRDIGL